MHISCIKQQDNWLAELSVFYYEKLSHIPVIRAIRSEKNIRVTSVSLVKWEKILKYMTATHRTGGV